MAGLRITGLATGMDIDGIVQDMIRAKRIPHDKMSQEKQTLEWKRDQYREMNTLLLGLREDTLNMRLTSSFLTKTTTSSNENKVTATANATAGNATYTFNNVERLASAATNASEKSISGADGKIDPKANIFSLQDKFAGDNNIVWKTTDGDGVIETVKVKSAGKDFKLNNLSGGTIIDEGLSSTINVNSKNKDGNEVTTPYTVITNKESFENSIEDDVVFLNKDTGLLTFKKELEADSSFELSYKYTHKETLTASETKTDFKLSNAGIPTDGIKSFKVTSYLKNSDGTIRKDSSGNAMEDSSKTKEYTSFTYNEAEKAYISSDGEVKISETGEVTFKNAVDQGAKIDVEYSYQYFDFKMQTHTSKGPVTETFKINGGDSFNSILDKITKSDLGVSAFYDEYADKVTLTRTETGDFNKTEYDKEMNFLGDPFLNNILQFYGRNEKGGEDAKFTINGLETGRHSNTFDINGVTFTLKDTFTESPVSIGSQTDVDKVYDNIKTFIDKYNEVIDKVNKKLGEEYHRDYQPLTKEQRDALSEDEVKLWEEKAKSGLLRRDQSLTNVLNKMRNDFYGPVSFEGNSVYSQLTTIGIKTTNLYNVNKGKLEIDEDQLKEAIRNDPEAVYQLFAADGDSYGEKGIARRLRDSLTSAITSIEGTAGNDIKTNSQFTIGKSLDSLEDRMTNFERRLKEFEDRYYRQFAAMEKAIQEMNQQSSYLMQQLGAWTAQ